MTTQKLPTKLPQTLQLLLGATIALSMSSVRALEVVAGDYEVFPTGINIALIYYQRAERANLYSNGSMLSNDFKLTSDIGLLRYVRPMQITERLVLDPQFILPFGGLNGSGTASVLGDTSGVGDLILGAPVKYLIDPVSRDAFSVGTFIHLRTGSYENTRALNLGENRWKGLMQLAYVKHFDAKWALDVIGDVQVSGANRKFGPTNATLKQKPRYEAQAHLRYKLTEATSVGVDYGYIAGGETRVSGVDRNDRLKTHYARVGGTHFFTPTLQGVLQVGRDISVESGPQERARINLRLAKIF